MKLDLSLTAYTKINSKWITNLNVRPKTIKLLKKNKGVNLHDLILDNGFLDMTPKAQTTKKENIDKLNFIKINICVAKDAIKKGKRKTEERANTCKLYT